ncbi:MAG: DUF1214 domain-containing protein [Deltaproteobacteria bacterium]|nr:DUF1214 domain-containing protein [Deltaproteobacteria bacterium]MBW2399843.1 DUF1214 domain-containing protein [Deltaproteobacteria bacterium]
MTLRSDKTTEAWQLFRKMLDDMTQMVESDAENELEKLEGLRVLGRTAALCLELNLDVEEDAPRFYSMATPVRFVGGPNPSGGYYLTMIDGTRGYRIRGIRGTSTYLGFQILAGRGLTPRRMGAYHSDRDLALSPDGTFSFVLAASEPDFEDSGAEQWVRIPDDSSAIVVREYMSDPEAETPAQLSIEPLQAPGPPVTNDEEIAEKLTAAAWTMAKLMTLHHTVMPELLEQPNRFFTAEAAELGSENTTPDNLYMFGTFRLADDEALVIELSPPATRYWSVTLESVWHECIEPHRRRSSITNGGAIARPDGTVRLVIAHRDPGAANWLDTGGRGRGFITVRWLDNPSAPPASTELVPLSEASD